MNPERPEVPARRLGVIEAITLVRDRCPHAAVREHAGQALAAVAQGGSPALRHQADLVLTTIAGWRGECADGVKTALRSFLDETRPGDEQTPDPSAGNEGEDSRPW